MAHGDWALQMVKEKGIDALRINNHLQKEPSEDSYEITIDTETGTMEVKKEDFNS